MNEAGLEHVNITASDGRRTAEMLCSVFGWRVRWQGPAVDGGVTWHVGTDAAYVAVYSPPASDVQASGRAARGRLNHIGVVVADLDATEGRAIEAGLKTFAHADYDPGRRFYFRDQDGVEFEVVSYS